MLGTPKAITPHTRMEVNGKAYGEVGMFINECGAKDIPVVLVSGDTAVRQEVRWQIPDSEFVVTKEALGPTCARTITPARSCRLIYEAAKRGVEQRQAIKPFKLAGPYTFKINELGDVYADPSGDFIEAYRNFLNRYYGYGKGWPEYNLRSEE